MKTADAIMDCFATQRMRDEMVVLRYAMQADFDDGLAGLSQVDSAAARDASDERCESPHIRWVPPAEGAADSHLGAHAPEHDQDYVTLRESLFSVAERLHEIGEDDASDSMRAAAKSGEPPRTWMFDATLAINAELALPTLPADLRDELDFARTAIEASLTGQPSVPLPVN